MNNFQAHTPDDTHGGWKNLLIGVTASVILLLCFYPQFVLFATTPMHANGWELSDPSVSWANFKPSFRVFQYELYNNVNVLWSSLRTMGMPILANDIQAAPLFPLTLLLSWLDEELFWNIFVSIRLFFMGLGTYLVARRFFRFQTLPAILFIISFIYALYVMRWMNNPWQNGLLSGIWYLYFLCLLLEQRSDRSFKRLNVFLGLSVSVFMMVTCGFPEASVMCAILVVLTYVPLLLARVVKRKLFWKPFLQDMVLAHIVGFALSSMQIFSIVELLAASESHRFVGLRQYSSSDLIPFFAENLTRFLQSGPSLYSDSRTYLGLIPLMLFLVGFGKTVFRFKKINAGDVGALLCGAFIVFKMFSIGPAWFNEIVAKPPVLRESYFYVYFFSIFLWFFAYFAAKGFQEICTIPQPDILNDNKVWRRSLLAVPIVVLVLLWYAAAVATKSSLWQLIIIDKQIILLKVVLLYLVAALSLQVWPVINTNRIAKMLFPFLVLGLVVVENRITLPTDFYTWHNEPDDQLETVLASLQKLDVPVVESRIIDRNGTYVSHGLATIDTGATPLLPHRAQVFRTNFFKTIRAGHLSIESPKSRFSWGISSTNLRAVDRYYGGGESFPEWNKLQMSEGGEIHLDRFDYNGKEQAKSGVVEITGGIDDFFYFRGWAIGDQLRNLEATAVYLVFENADDEVIVPVRRAVRHDVAEHLGNDAYIMAGWDSYISASLLKDGRYALSIRFADLAESKYYEFLTDCEIQFKNLKNDDTKPFLFGVAEQQKTFLGVLDQYYIYLDRTALPRAYVASQCDYFSSMKKVVQEFRTTTSFKLGDAYVENLSEEDARFCKEYKRDVSRVAILRDGGDELTLDTVKGPAIVVLNDNMYGGWQAYDMKQHIPLEIKPVNITFRSVLLPENREYSVKFVYRPVWLPYALCLVAVGLFCIAVPVILTVNGYRREH